MARRGASNVLWFALLFAVLASAHAAKNPNDKNQTLAAGLSNVVYVSLDAEKRIAIYEIDSATGSLRIIKSITVNGDPGSLAVDPSRNHLYAAIRSTNSISSFRIDNRTGDLTLMNTIHAAGNPVYVGTDKTGKFLLTAYFGDSKAAIYSIRPDGSLRDSAVQILETASNAHAIQTDPTNHYVFVPCRTGETILQFKFNSDNGVLTPNTPDRMLTPTKTGPRHLAFHKSLNIVYFANEFGSTVTTYRLNPEGTLSELQTLSSLPKDFAGPNTGADVHLTPDGRFLYASNRGHESIAAFSVDSITGTLTSHGQFATEKTPRAFAIDPTGNFLYSGGQGSGRIAAYRINRQNGQLIPIANYDAGKNPVWILTMPEKPGY
jgi:6-phosphogluconolactonase